MEDKIQKRRNSKIEDWLTTKMTAGDEEKKSEVKVVFLGPPHKSQLFDKLCQAATKFEKHVHYDDTFYLTVGNGDRSHTIQFTDPGLARTGGREMAIRCADVAVLVYSAGSSASLEQLKSLREDFERRKHIPIRLICDLDEIYEDEDDGFTASSTSEGYESDVADRENRIRRHASMEKIRKIAEDLPVATEEGRKLAVDLGEGCIFLQINGSTYAEADGFLRDLIEASTKRRKGRSRSLLPKLKSKSKDRENSVVITKDANSAHSSVHSSGSNEDSPSRRNSRRNSQVKESKVCAIM